MCTRGHGERDEWTVHTFHDTPRGISVYNCIRYRAVYVPEYIKALEQLLDHSTRAFPFNYRKWISLRWTIYFDSRIA